MAVGTVTLRVEPASSDREGVLAVVTEAGVFREDELAVAVELVEERLEKGERSGYHFAFAEVDGELAGYACWGPIPCTIGGVDLYWIAVRPAFQGRGLGRLLADEAERAAAHAGGRRMYIETSSREEYGPARRFYERSGYSLEARLPDFYAPGDSKLIYAKALR